MSWEKWEYGTFQYGHYKPKIYEEPEVMENDHFLWKYLKPEEIETAVEVLRGYCSDERLQRLEGVLGARTENVRMVYENPANANNVWAALRTLDSFGVQYVDCVMDPIKYKKGWRRNTMVSAMGAQKWLSLTQHENTASCLDELRGQGYRIIAADLTETSKPIEEIDWNEGKVAVFMGNELTGISDELRAAACETFYIPTKGFAESLNVSVAAAVLCTLLEQKGTLKADLCEDEKPKILLTWLARTVPGSLAILRREGYKVKGNSLYQPMGKFTTKP